MSPTTLRIVGSLTCALLSVADSRAIEKPHSLWQMGYDELAKSNDPADKRLLKSWDKLVAPQMWISADGKKVRARVYDLDEKSGIVFLATPTVVDGKKSERVDQVHIDKLNKVCQARVKEITTLAEQLADVSRKIQNAADPRPGEKKIELIKIVTDPTPPPRTSNWHNAFWCPDKKTWRLSYQDFRKQLSAKMTADGHWEYSFGTLTNLRQWWDSAQREYAARQSVIKGEISNDDYMQIHAREKAFREAVPVAEVKWEGNVSSDKGIDFIRGKKIDWQPLPDAFTISFVHYNDANEAAVNYLNTPQRVVMIGRFDDPSITGAPNFRVDVRFPDDQPKQKEK